MYNQSCYIVNLLFIVNKKFSHIKTTKPKTSSFYYKRNVEIKL